MSKVVFLRLGQGNLQTGFSTVNVRLEGSGGLIAQKSGCLPADLDLARLLMEWQFLYAAFYDQQRYRLRGEGVQVATVEELEEIEFEETGITSYSEQEFREIVEAVHCQMQTWLNSAGMLEINNLLRTWLQTDEEIQVLIETDDLRLQQLPWHCWQFFEDYRQAEPSFSAPNFEQRSQRSKQRKLRILIVLGNREGIDSTGEEAVLRQLRAETTFLVEPSLKDLTDALRHPKGWDIFFFTGHSSSQAKGQFFLNATETVTVDDLRYALIKAISQGLKLAIFNSCDGSRLAQDLQALNIPTAIVMKEPVPNQVAQDFVRSFLQSFAAGASLQSAVRSARESLQGSERDFPCASWLPGIWQNPAVAPFRWKDKEVLPLPNRKISWQAMLATSLMVAGLVMGVRSLGWLEPSELCAYDRFMTWRPLTEQPDPRLLIVGVTEEDLEQYGYWNENRRLLSDLAVATLLKTLKQHKPRVIGLDIIRNTPIGEGQAELLKELQPKNSNVITVCQMPSDEGDHQGFKPPSGIPAQQVGFINFDYLPDGVVRRHLLGMTQKETAPGTCNTDHALSTRLAVRYFGYSKAEETPQKDIQIGATVLPILKGDGGGYRSEQSKQDLQNSYQFLLNYRAAPKAANQVTFTQVLAGKVATSWMKDKLILIGYVAPSANDYHATPYTHGNELNQKMPGVVIHAHMVSQILSAVEDKRPLLRPWSDLGESGWILVWAGVGGLLFWRCRSLWLLVATCLALGILGIGSFILFCVGAWVPLIPAGIGLSGTVTGLVIASRFQQPNSSVLSYSKQNQ